MCIWCHWSENLMKLLFELGLYRRLETRNAWPIFGQHLRCTGRARACAWVQTFTALTKKEEASFGTRYWNSCCLFNSAKYVIISRDQQINLSSAAIALRRSINFSLPRLSYFSITQKTRRARALKNKHSQKIRPVKYSDNMEDEKNAKSDKDPQDVIKDPSRLVQALTAIQTLERQPNPQMVDKSSMRRFLRQGSSIDLKNVVDVKNESRVLVLYTGK